MSEDQVKYICASTARTRYKLADSELKTLDVRLVTISTFVLRVPDYFSHVTVCEL